MRPPRSFLRHSRTDAPLQSRLHLLPGFARRRAARGYDWDETLADVLRFLDSLETDQIKVEFQGGEPLLRIDC